MDGPMHVSHLLPRQWVRHVYPSLALAQWHDNRAFVHGQAHGQCMGQCSGYLDVLLQIQHGALEHHIDPCAFVHE